MLARSLTAAAAGLALLLLAGCQGGSEGASIRSAPCSQGASTFCLVSCNLGCSESTCSVSRIAQNQELVLNFNQPVDPASVTEASVSIRTPSGEAPIGDLLVDGATVIFRPKVEISGGSTFFGFRANETYVLTLPAGTSGSLRSISGDALSQQVVCQLVVDRGIVDRDNQPPKPTLVSPIIDRNVPTNISIVIEFSELIDAAPFAGGGEGGPIEYFASIPETVGGQLQCDDEAERRALPGVPRVTLNPVRNISTVTFRSSIALPAEACIEVRVTAEVRDLSGRRAEPVTYFFLTGPSTTGEQSITEEFDSVARLDTTGSSTVWEGGIAKPGLIGGTGRHGEFDHTLGVLNAGVWEWDLGRSGGFRIPGTNTLDGRDDLVTNGVFEFTRFVLPAGVTVRFLGPFAPRILVRGECSIEGTLQLSASTQAQFTASSNTPVPGQPGGRGGAGGGSGGDGADSSDGNTNSNGDDGATVRLLAGHAYAGRAVNTGGRGAIQWPPVGTPPTFNFGGTLCLMLPSGGGGGGFMQAGGTGRVLGLQAPPSDKGPDTLGGSAFDPFPVPGTSSSFEHFLIGGSGGGGGASHLFNRSQTLRVWRPGVGGSGGGGAIGIRAGGAVLVTAAASIEARGGGHGAYDSIFQGPPGMAGAGSGGSVVLQSGVGINALGTIDVTGGGGARIAPRSGSPLLEIETVGGNGSPGFVRAEMPNNPGLSILASVLPARDPRMVGDLVDRDRTTGFVTKWFSVPLIFPPTYLRYEVDARIDGQPVTYSDDPARGIWANIDAGNPVWLLFQTGDVDPRTGQLVGPASGYRTTVGAFNGQPGITPDGKLGFRFTLIFNKQSATQQIEIRSVKVLFRG